MSKVYYVTCPDCGTNLDPGEKCDCKNKRLSKSETLYLGFDSGDNKMDTVLTITRPTADSKLELVKQIVGVEAGAIYSLLTD